MRIGIIGLPNSGKTTLFNCISGLHQTTSGKILFGGEDVTDLKAYEVARRGLARTFQVYTASGDLNVAENVMVGCFMRTRSRARAKARANEIINASLTDKILREKGIEATLKLAESPNAKVVVIGNTKDGMPLILGDSK